MSHLAHLLQSIGTVGLMAFPLPYVLHKIREQSEAFSQGEAQAKEEQ